MSGGRRFRRSVGRHRVERCIAEAEQSTPRLIGRLSPHTEAWAVGPVLMVLPVVPWDGSPELIEAVTRRRQAAFTGVCECGARRRIVGERVVFEHEDDCDARDEAIRLLVEGGAP